MLSVPEVKDWGNASENFYAWNNGSMSSLIQTTSGVASGACIIDRKSREGYLTLRGKELGTFKVKAPL